MQIAADRYAKGQEHGCEFESNASFKSVTSCVSIGSIANMTLIDTPGLNDPNAARTDKKIYIEMIKSISEQLYDNEQGISSLILCLLPNASQRIRDTTIKAMLSAFFMFNSLDDRVTITEHPKYHVIINNVSKYDENQKGSDEVNKDPNQLKKVKTNLST